MTTKLNGDGNIIGRLGAIALLVAVGYGIHKLGCDDGMCPVMKTDSCCGSEAHPAAAAPATPVPAK